METCDKGFSDRPGEPMGPKELVHYLDNLSATQNDYHNHKETQAWGVAGFYILIIGGIFFRDIVSPDQNQWVWTGLLGFLAILIVIYSFRLAYDKKKASECIHACHQKILDILYCQQQGKFNPKEYPMENTQKPCHPQHSGVVYPAFLLEAIKDNTIKLPDIDILRIILVISTAAVSVVAVWLPVLVHKGAP